MRRKLVRVVLDSNIIISGLVYGGNPEKCLRCVAEGIVQGVVSESVLTEVLEVLAKKFSYSVSDLENLKDAVEVEFEKVYPAQTLNISRDPDDNRVLEAAVEGECRFVVTGDKDLLTLGKHKDIQILTPTKFLAQLPT